MMYKTTLFIFVLLVLCRIYPTLSDTIFSIQESLTVLCSQFPLISAANNSDIQCGRLRTDENVPTTMFDLNRPTEIVLFIIVDQSASKLSSTDITINFNQSSDSPSSINDIRLVLLVTDTNFTINNQNTSKYTQFQIPILHWQNSRENTYDLIDLVYLGNQEYEIDASICKWDSTRWDRLFSGNMSNNVSYVYFVKTTNPQLIFTLTDTSSKSSLLSPPSPYLNILYCVPYKLELTEMVLIICFGVFFICVIITVGILHYIKAGEGNRSRHFERYHHRGVQDKSVKNSPVKVRRRTSVSVSSVEQNDQASD